MEKCDKCGKELIREGYFREAMEVVIENYFKVVLCETCYHKEVR